MISLQWYRKIGQLVPHCDDWSEHLQRISGVPDVQNLKKEVRRRACSEPASGSSALKAQWCVKGVTCGCDRKDVRMSSNNGNVSIWTGPWSDAGRRPGLINQGFLLHHPSALGVLKWFIMYLMCFKPTVVNLPTVFPLRASPISISSDEVCWLAPRGPRDSLSTSGEIPKIDLSGWWSWSVCTWSNTTASYWVFI